MSLSVGQSKLVRPLQLLERAADYYNSVDLSTTIIVCIQHLYCTTYCMFQELFKKGLHPSNLLVLGKCYSTDPEVYEQLKKDGVNVSVASMDFDSHQDYDMTMEDATKQLIRDAFSRISSYRYQKIIILDDGGTLINLVSNMHLENLDIIGVEQTSAGYNRIKMSGITFPVINVARSWIKAKHESPIIVSLALRKLKEKIYFMSPKPTDILIMGYGILGKEIKKQLSNSFLVSYFDLDINKSMFSLSQLKDELCNFDLIIGTTGETSISKSLFPYLKKPVTLASVSSSDREFDSVKLRRKKPKTNNCHQDLFIDRIQLLNCGFPINFDSNFKSIDSDEFQLTRAIIFGAVCQGAITLDMEPKFLPLNNEFQHYIENNFLEVMA